MRTTLIFTTLIFGFWCTGQTIRNLNDISTEMIYRGFENTIVISPDGLVSQNEFTLACTECLVTKINQKGDSLPPNTFILIPNKARSTDLLMISKNGDTTIHQFKIANLPDPEFFLNEIKSGESLAPIMDASKWVLSARYPVEIGLVSVHHVISWECTVDGVLFSSSQSNVIPEELIIKIRSLPSGSKVTFKAVVVGERDGISRYKTGVFLVK